MAHKTRILCAVLLTQLLCSVLPALASELPEHPLICITVRDYGDIYAELYPEYAPATVENFLQLTGNGFYDGLTFHRIIAGFMIQGGDPLGNGTGGSAQKIKGEFAQNGVDNPLKHQRGVLSMARSSDPDSASSQFFIMHAESAHLDGAYAAFGRVLCGMPTVDQICLLTPVQDNNGTVAKADQPVIGSVRVVDAAEADAARAAEAANGQAGSVYHDPYTPMTFPVPARWARTAWPDANTALFQTDSAPDKALVLLSMDAWQRYGTQLEQMGLTRDTLDTDAAVRLGLIRTGGTEQTSETHSDIRFYTAELQSDGVTRTLYAGVYHGSLYQFIFTGGRDDPLFSDVTAILDSLEVD